jgi:hypothetical protein
MHLRPLLRPFVLLSALAGWAAPAISDASSPLFEPPIEIDVMELTDIQWTPGETLPPEVTRYDGKKVVINGYMHGSVTGDVSAFPLVSDACQCTGELQPHHFIQIDLGDGQTGPIPGSFEVIGRLKVGVKKKDGFVESVYRLRGRLY